MKQLLLLIVFTMTFVSSIKAADDFDINLDPLLFTFGYSKKTSEEELRKLGVYFGNTLENKIIAKDDMYVIIHNPTKLSLTVMEQEAKNYCNKLSTKYNYASYFMRVLGKYTAYFSCEMANKVDQYDLPDEEKQCIIDRFYERSNCEQFNKKNTAIIDEIELQNTNEGKYKKLDFIHLIKTKYHDQIVILENYADQKYNEQQNQLEIQNKIRKIKQKIDILSSPFNTELNQLKVEKNKEICKNYTFVEGSKEFSQCLLQLIKNEKLE